MAVHANDADLRCCEGCRVRKILVTTQRVYFNFVHGVGISKCTWNEIVYQNFQAYWRTVTDEWIWKTGVVIPRAYGPLNGPIDEANPPVPIGVVVCTGEYSSQDILDACLSDHAGHTFNDVPNPPEGGITYGLTQDGVWTTGNGYPQMGGFTVGLGYNNVPYSFPIVCYPAGSSMWVMSPDYIAFAAASVQMDLKGRGCKIDMSWGSDAVIETRPPYCSDGVHLRDWNCEMIGSFDCDTITNHELLFDTVPGFQMADIQNYGIACKAARYKFIIPECGFCPDSPNPAP